MTRAEIRAVGDRLETLPDLILLMIKNHPNQIAEMAANELTVRNVKREYVSLGGKRRLLEGHVHLHQ